MSNFAAFAMIRTSQKPRFGRVAVLVNNGDWFVRVAVLVNNGDWFGRVAQLVERPSYTRMVLGSIPSTPTI